MSLCLKGIITLCLLLWHEGQDSNANLSTSLSVHDLGGMGEFLEESWAEGYVQELTTHAHAESSSCFYFASMASGMTRLMHEMQIERGLSCRACAASADEAMKDSGTTKASERLQQQRGKTDKSLRQLIELVKIASSLAELGKLEARHQDCCKKVPKTKTWTQVLFQCQYVWTVTDQVRLRAEISIDPLVKVDGSMYELRTMFILGWNCSCRHFNLGLTGSCCIESVQSVPSKTKTKGGVSRQRGG